MDILNLIDGLEKAIVEHYINIDEKRKGWTVLQNLKSEVDYTHGDEKWEVCYLKKLSDKVDELNIRNLVKQ